MLLDCALLHLAQHADEITAPEFGDVLRRVAAFKEFARDVRAFAHIGIPTDSAAVIEVGAETDVVDANQTDGVVDGIEPVDQRGERRFWREFSA